MARMTSMRGAAGFSEGFRFDCAPKRLKSVLAGGALLAPGTDRREPACGGCEAGLDEFGTSDDAFCGGVLAGLLETGEDAGTGAGAAEVDVGTGGAA